MHIEKTPEQSTLLSLLGIIQNNVELEKDAGVAIRGDLSFDSHIYSKVKRTSKSQH